MQISSHFDSGNIEVVDASDPGNVQLNIRVDHAAEHYQWFHFRVSNARELPLTMHLLNAKGASYVEGWKDYQACASYDRVLWFRVPTKWDGDKLTIEHTPIHDSVHYAYFAPYSMERHGDLISQAQCDDRVELEVLGQTLDGFDMDLLRITEGDPEGKKNVWIWARQHPGETMAEWLIEGLLERLLDDEDPVGRAVLSKAVLHVIPNMNPDGSFRGHLRCNASGANLNREWVEPSMERSPEVFLVRKKMEEVGVDFGLDVHGDEALPYNFISGLEGIPSLSDKQRDLQASFMDALVTATPDFQTKHGYPIDEPGKANLTMASNWVGERFGCLAMTLEMPFKDTADTPHELGWSPERSKRFGWAQLDALRAILHKL